MKGGTIGQLCGELYLYYGLRIGLSLDDALDMPKSLLDDLIASDQIISDGFKRKPTAKDNERELRHIFSLR